MALLVADSEVLWLNIMNGTLGLVVLICCVVFTVAVIHQFRSTKRQRARDIQGLDAEMHEFLGEPDRHSLHVPELGLTMADGGEPADPDAKKRAEKRG